jgi:hypothetical protein
VDADLDTLATALYVIPEGAGTVNLCRKMAWGLYAAPSVQAGSRQPADGSTVERPKHSEDERPWGCQGLTQGGSGGVTVAWSMASLRQGVEADGSSIASNRWPWAARSSGAGHPFAAPRRHGAVRPQPSGLNQVGRPRRRAGVMTPTSTRRAAPEPFTSPSLAPGPGSALGHRAGRSKPG